MKLYALQEDFSAGELSPKAQGHVTADIYKAGARRMINCFPSRSGSVMSRAGTKHVVGALGLGVPGVGPVTDATHGDLRPGVTQFESRGQPVQHVAIHDGPYGEFVLEAGPYYFRILDKHKGVRTWHRPILDTTAPDVVYGAVNDVQPDSWGHPESDTVYLNNRTGVGQRSWKVNARRNVNGVLVVPETDPATGFPFGTDESFTVVGYTAGDVLTLRITLHDGTTEDHPLTIGRFSVRFTPAQAFTLTFLQAPGVVQASSVWGVSISKNGMQTVSSFLSSAAPLRADSFWITNKDDTVLVDGVPVRTVIKQFVVVVVVGSVPLVLVWTGHPVRNGVEQPDTIPLMTEWTMRPLPFKGGTPSWAGDVTAIAAYQGRLWMGLGDAEGSLHASEIGFGSTTPLTSDGISDVNTFEFEFRLPSNLTQQARFVAAAGQTDFAFSINTRDVSQVSVTKNGNSIEFRAELNASQDNNPGGTIFIDATVGGEAVVITIKPLLRASDPLDLTLATPTGRIVWMNVLHGLVLGSTRMEKQFQQGATLALDPAIGQTFDIIDHSSLGSDENLPAVNVNQKILFFQRGRQILREMSVRYMWESGLPQGGLVADDVSAPGEHLLRARVRSFCFLKSPVPRLVFALEDGSGAVATLGGKSGYAWSRLSLDSALGGIYSVCSLTTAKGSELWIGTGCGATLQCDVVESDVTSKVHVVAGVAPLADTTIGYDTETPLPPIMDAWVKTGIGVFLFGTPFEVATVAPLPEVFAGRMLYVIIAGEKYGPYLAQTNNVLFPDGSVYAVIPAADLPGLEAVWTDEAGSRRVTEAYVGAAYPEHRCTTLPLELANPGGTSQAQLSRKPQLYARLVDSYIPLINGNRPPERNPDDPTDLFAGRVTGDRRATELGFTRGAVVDIVMDYPLRFEISALFGGTQINHL